jgi:hypothetical protein
VTPTELNNLCIHELETAGLQDGKYVAIVGAGPSSPYIPSFKDLIKTMGDACGVTTQSRQPTWEFFQDAYNHNEQEYCRVIRESFGMTPYWDSRTYVHIIEMPFVSFVTLNYEDQLPSAFRTKFPRDFSGRFSVYPTKPNLRLAMPCEFHRQHLVAIHGYRDKNSQDWPRDIILKTNDYNYHYVSHEAGQRLFSWWMDLLTLHPCIFIGTSLSEPGIQSVVKYLVEDQNPRFKQWQHVHLINVEPPTVQNGQLQEPMYPTPGKTFGVIRQLYYDPLDARFTGLLKILTRFSGLPIDDPEPGLRAPEPITVTSNPEF